MDPNIRVRVIRSGSMPRVNAIDPDRVHGVFNVHTDGQGTVTAYCVVNNGKGALHDLMFVRISGGPREDMLALADTFVTLCKIRFDYPL